VCPARGILLAGAAAAALKAGFEQGQEDPAMWTRTTAWAALPLMLLAIEARAADFRIQSKVFGEAPSPLAENLTLFRAGAVYDYLEEPATVTVFDPARGRFLLLDPARRRQTEVSADEVEHFVSRLKERCVKEPEGFLRFMADPQFDAKQDQASGELVLSSAWLTYRVSSIQAQSADELEQYRQFADAYARLNTLTNPGNIPPFARLALNATLFQRNEIPERVRLDLTGPKPLGQQQVTFRSEHLVTRRLLEGDLQRINQTAKDITTFNTVSLKEFTK
jgi:hypothetical protein